MKYETVIGLEIHAQLKTQTKMFCGCANLYGEKPNSLICPVCMAEPGALPVLNKQSVELALRAGLALESNIQANSIFARKNYFYPDLTKSYQISQYEYPLIFGGHVDIQDDNKKDKRISITRIHLEEDAGKLIHDLGNTQKSHVDFNRCGVPLIEIVSGPDIRSAQEAGNYLRKLRQILIYTDVTRGNMKEGNLRCDANISIRPCGQKEFGTRTEVKNLNSFKAVERAIEHEAKRQQKVIEAGKKVALETLLWDDDAGQTRSMRSKEEAHDYRYFPDPDLLPLHVNEAWIEKVSKTMPELAQAKSERFVSAYGIPEYDASVLTAEKALADYFEACIKHYNAPKKISNWIMTELLRELKNDHTDITQCQVQAKQLATLVKLIDDGTISGKIGKDIIIEMYKTGKDPAIIIDEKGFKQVSDEGELEKIIDEVMSNNPQQLEQYRAGKDKLFGFFVGQVMKASRGQANPDLVNKLLKKKL